MKRNIKKDIAIIGMAGKYPNSDNLDQFWNHLVEGNELIQFYTDEELRNLGVSEEKIISKNFVGAQSVLESSGNFDYAFFGYSKHEALVMDPQIRIMHELVWTAMEDAGYAPDNIKNKVGMYLSASDNLNWKVGALLSNNELIDPFFLKQISNQKFISTLISYKFNFHGPSLYVDTGCSSSLVATHLACRSLLLKECSVALAGGVGLDTSTNIGYSYEEGKIDSKDGHCKPFDKDSSGTISGDGAGIVVLKRLEDALEDNDQIYAVIRSTYSNNDGNRKVGYTAPSVNGQYECIKGAHRVAGVDTSSITYIEAHGTATRLGDPIEVEALNKAFGYNTDNKCALGSVKSNLGHLDAAAGVTGLIKTALSIKNKLIPASLHFENPSPEINFDSGPFYVNAKKKIWQEDFPLRAGVSSFGIGGTNAHVVLEEAEPKESKRGKKRDYHLIYFSAKTNYALSEYQNKLEEVLKKEGHVSMSDMSYTMLKGRSNFIYNKFFVCESANEAISILNGSDKESLFSAKYMPKKDVCFMFSGSGAQYINMGKDLYFSEPYFRHYIIKGLDYLLESTGTDFSNIIYSQKLDEELLIHKIEYTQPLIFIFGYALAQLFMFWGVQPKGLIGHSTGEYIAAAISGVFNFETALELVVARARLMSSSPKGRMLSVGLSEEKLLPYINENCQISVINSPEYCAVSGTEDAINDLYDVLEEKEISCSKLKISIGAHSFLMDSILEEYKSKLDKVNFSLPTIPFVSNVTGKWIEDEEVCSSEYWLKHLRSSVRFSDGVKLLLKEKDTVFLEMGPSNMLTNIFNQHKDFNTNKNTVINTVRHPKEEINDQKYLLQKIGELKLNGIDLDWNNYFSEEKPSVISIPTYAFKKTVLPSKINLFENLQSTNEDYSFSWGIDEKQEDEDAEDNWGERSNLLAEYVAPDTETEERLIELWQNFFHNGNIGVLDSFFSLGGDSLKGYTMIKMVQKIFGIKLNLKDFYTKSTIRELAEEIELAKKMLKLQQQKSTTTSTLKI